MPRVTSDTPSIAPAPLHAAVAREQLRMLLAHTEVGILAATAFAALVAYGLHRGVLAVVAPQLVTAWFCAKVAVAIPRGAAAYFARSPDPRLARLGARCTIPFLAVDGAVWGLGAAYLMGGAVESWSLIAAFVCCVACVATFGLQVRLAATAAYVGPMIAPTSAALLLQGGTAADTAAFGLAVLLGLLLSTAQRSERRITELIELRLHTEQVSAERADALALAKRHSHAKDRFLAVVSHELRTPLHGILGLTRLTRSDLPKIATTTLAHHRLSLIEDAGVHLQRMVDDLLDISFMESGRLQLQPAPFNLLHELCVISETYAARAPEVGVGFKAFFQPSLDGLVVGDAARITQVLHNLLGNAFKFTPLGGRISLEVERANGSSEIRFMVRDTGPGVPEAEREAIFDIFTQGTVGGSRPEGVGLGLAISRQLAREMEGDVHYEPGGASGSAFVFTATLPTKLALVGTAPPQASYVPRKSQYAGLAVFLADDDPGSALVAGTVIRALGCELESFTNGADLVERFVTTARRPDAIVVDWDMPKLDGRSAALAIRQHERAHQLRPVPIIGISANPSPSYSLAGIRAGMTVFLTKPCPPEDLAAAITEHIGREASIGDPIGARPASWTVD